MEQKKHYLVYKTTCLLNGKIYIGQHQTYEPNDDYLGSGLLLKEDVKRFGRENFKREILFDFDNFEEMDNKEKELVTEEFISREDTYNVRVGGQNDCLSDLNSRARMKFLCLVKTNEEFKKRFSCKMRDVMKKLWAKHPEHYRFPPNNDWWTGKHHTEESKRKIGMKNSRAVKGEFNGNYGKQWVSDTVNDICYSQDKKIPLENFQLPIRIMDFEKWRSKNAECEMEKIRRVEHQERLHQIQQTFFSAFYDEYLKNGFEHMCKKFGLDLEISAFLHLCRRRIPHYASWKRKCIRKFNGGSHKSSAAAFEAVGSGALPLPPTI